MVQLTLASISQHLTKDVVDKAFKLRTNSEDDVQSVEITRAAPAGEGLISAVYRIQVTGKNHKAKFVVKGLVSDATMRKSLNCQTFFEREALFFTTILPILSATQNEAGAKERIQNYLPICFSCHCDGKDDYILMEDMSESQCSAISEYPTIRERNLTLKSLAHFHAVSMALRVKKPGTFAKLANGLDEIYYNDENRNWYANYLQEAINIDKKVLAEFEDPESIYYKKFNAVVNDDLYGQLIRIVNSRGDHPVFNHGDAWCPNFLCCKDKAVAIDFQILRCSSPAADLSYFILMCSSLCRSKEEFWEAVEVYYLSLEYYLSDMGVDASKVFSFDMLKEELKKYGSYGLLASITSFPLLASERCDTLKSFEEKYSDCDRIPLEELWPLTPIKHEEHKLRLVNAVRVAVDVGLV
uniref:CHK kinase-like domain-containing protein n=1 Tax=Heliothis virescens TaxID=7102 RepID=A0A2A4JM67_HELVI